MNGALGMIEVEGVAGIIVGADAALKAAAVQLLGWDSIGGFTTAFFSGSVSDVHAALERGGAAAREVADHVLAESITRADPVCSRYITRPLSATDARPVTDRAVGVLEARGYGIQVVACDRMVKAAAVQVTSVLTVHNRVVCVLIQGDVGAVQEAVAVGREVMSDYEHFLCVRVIAQPAPGLLSAFAATTRS